MTEYEAFLRQEAPRRGIDPDVAVRVARAEGGLTEPVNPGDKGSSFWAFQLHYGGKGYEHLHPTAGVGNGFSQKTGWKPGDPKAWRDAMRYALDVIKAGGWGPWHAAPTVGVRGFDGIDRSVQWNGTPDNEWDFKNPTRPHPVPSVPPRFTRNFFALKDLWFSVRPDIPLNPDAGIFKTWAEKPYEYGVPVGPEHVDGNDKIQPFTRCFIRWTPSGPVIER